MEFMKVQQHETNQLIRWFVDKREVARSEYELLREKQVWKGKNYNTSYMVRDVVTNNYIHVHHFN